MTSDPIVSLDVVVLGGAAVDLVAQVESLPQRDSLALAYSYAKFSGGSAANVAVGIARLGRRVGFVGKLGDDENGRMLLEAFEQEGVDTLGVIVETDRPTATCFIGVDKLGDRIIFGLPGASLIEDTEELDRSYLRNSQALYIGPSYANVAAVAAVAAREQGVSVFYAPGSGWGPDGLAHLCPVLEQSDVLLVSHTEATELTGLTSQAETLHVLSRTGPPVVVETLGAQGTIVLAHGHIIKVSSFATPHVQDTTGAGDAFAAGLIVGFLESLDWEGATRMGCAAAALKIRHIGARSGLPTRKEIAVIMGNAEPDGRTKC